jgi:hypothetical protein
VDLQDPAAAAEDAPLIYPISNIDDDPNTLTTHNVAPSHEMGGVQGSISAHAAPA